MQYAEAVDLIYRSVAFFLMLGAAFLLDMWWRR